MGQDYLYTQPSSSADSLDMTSLLEAEGELYKDEDDSRFLHQVYGDEAEDGMPSTCYCGSDAVFATSYTRKESRALVSDMRECIRWGLPHLEVVGCSCYGGAQRLSDTA